MCYFFSFTEIYGNDFNKCRRFDRRDCDGLTWICVWITCVLTCDELSKVIKVNGVL